MGQLLRDLQTELPCGAEDHRLRLIERGVDFLDNRDPERTGLPGAGRRLADHIPSLHHRGDRLFLYLGQLGKAHLLDRAGYFGTDLEGTILHTLHTFTVLD